MSKAIKVFIGRSVDFYIAIAIFAGLTCIMWNVFGLADYFHAPHISFLAAAGSAYILNAVAAWIGYSAESGKELQRINRDRYPYP